MTAANIRGEYFDWLFNMVCANRYSEQISYKELLEYLHDIEFRYLIPIDENRAQGGIDLRYRFAVSNGYRDCADDILDILDAPCSIFEMMVALAIRCEETMADPVLGDRTAQWFWEMIVNLGLGAMYNKRFDRRYVDDVIERFLNREYEPNGKGGLFTVRNCDCDLRDVEIWHQLCYYMDTMI